MLALFVISISCQVGYLDRRPALTRRENELCPVHSALREGTGLHAFSFLAASTSSSGWLDTRKTLNYPGMTKILNISTAWTCPTNSTSSAPMIMPGFITGVCSSHATSFPAITACHVQHDKRLLNKHCISGCHSLKLRCCLPVRSLNLPADNCRWASNLAPKQRASEPLKTAAMRAAETRAAAAKAVRPSCRVLLRRSWCFSTTIRL